MASLARCRIQRTGWRPADLRHQQECLMASPITAIAGVGMAASAVGGILGGIGAKQSGQANAAAYRYKAGVALLNKQINEQNASWATQAGGAKAEVEGLKSKQQIGETKVVQSASGFDVNSGNNEKVRETQTDVAQYDQNVIRWDAAKTAYGYETKATTDVAEAHLDQMAASQAEEAGELGMWGSFISGAGNVAGKWMQEIGRAHV